MDGLSATSCLSPVYINGAAITTGTAKLVIDDVVLYDYVDGTHLPSFDSANTALKAEATSVKTSQAHTLIFDQHVTANTDTVKIYKKSDDATKTAVAATVNAVQNRVTITPSESLEKGTKYVLDFSGVTSSTGEALDSTSATTLNFTTSLLMPPPVLEASSIEDGAVDVAASTKSLTVTFDQAIDIASSTVKLTYGTDGEISATISATGNENEYTVSWMDALSGKTEYTVDLSGVKNSENPEPAGDSVKLSFTTEDTRLKLVSSVPEANEDSAPIALKQITLTFNQEITEYPKTISLKGGEVDISATVATTDNYTFTLTWDEALSEITKYTADISGFANEKGNSQTTSYSFKTEYGSIRKLSDGFDDSSLINVVATTTYGNASSVLTMNASSAGTDVTQDKVLALQTVSGDNEALLLTTGSEAKGYVGAVRTTQKYSITDEEKLISTWKFNLKEQGLYDSTNGYNGTKIGMGIMSSTALSFGGTLAYIYTHPNDGGNPCVYFTGDSASTRRQIKEDNWYNVIMTMGAYCNSITIIDADERSDTFGKAIFTKSVYNTTTTPWYSEVNPAYIHIASGSRISENGGIYNANQELLLDDFTLWRIKPTAPHMALSLAETGDTEITPDGVISMTFNQPVMAGSTMFELYKGTSKNELACSTVNASLTDFCTQEVSFSNLQYLTDYTLDYSGVTAVSGAGIGADDAAATLSFSTEADPNAMSIVGDISCTGLNTDDKVEFNLYSREASQAMVIAAFYKRSFPEKLEGVEIKEISAISGINPVSIELTKEHTADYIKLYVWNGMNTFAPLSRVYEIHAPADTLDVLMIGNSLSEDAGRYFNKIAQAGGLTLDLTVKGVGGSSLSHHAANLKAELGGRTAADAAADPSLDRPLYFTYKNGVLQTATAESLLLITALREKQYDIISLQQYGTYTDAAFEDSLPYLAEQIRMLQPNAEIVLYQPWSPKSGVKTTRNSTFTNTIEPAVAKWAAYTGANVENIILNGEPMKIVSAGKAFYLADNKFDWCEAAYTAGEGNTNPEAQTGAEAKMKGAPGLWRDYDHGSYYGCYLADAVWFGTLTGKKAPVTDAEGNPVVSAPDGVTREQHIERLTQLSNIAYQVVIEQNN